MLLCFNSLYVLTLMKALLHSPLIAKRRATSKWNWEATNAYAPHLLPLIGSIIVDVVEILTLPFQGFNSSANRLELQLHYTIRF